MTLDPELLASVTVALACVGVLLVCGEVVALRAHLGAGGLFDWEVSRTGRRLTVCGASGRVLHGLLRPSRLPVTLGVVMVTAAVPLVVLTTASGDGSVGRSALLVCLVVALLGQLLLGLRLGAGVDAGDRMLTLVLVGCVAYHAAASPIARDVALWFVGAQGVLAYTVAGWSKLASARWRSGVALAAILSTRTFGTPAIGAALRRHPAAARVLSWGVIGFECSALLAVLAGPRAVLAFVAAGVGFHLATATVMRLNHFVWAFAATYPAMLHLASGPAGILSGRGGFA